MGRCGALTLSAQVTTLQLACMQALAAVGSLLHLVSFWSNAGFRSLLRRQESAERFVGMISACYTTNPALLMRVLHTDSGTVRPSLPRCMSVHMQAACRLQDCWMPAVCIAGLLICLLPARAEATRQARLVAARPGVLRHERGVYHADAGRQLWRGATLRNGALCHYPTRGQHICACRRTLTMIRM